jgi:RNA-binding protein YlmH
MEETEFTKKRFAELADRSYTKGQFTFTQFLGMADLSLFYEEKRTLDYVKPTVFGGYDGAERAVVRFGDPESLGYEENFPIDILAIVPLVDKFADDLTHRDFLGALMSLGIERSLLGDIIVTGKKAYIFCLERISDFIIENLISVKHTSVSVRKAETEDIKDIPRGFEKEKMIQVASERIDAVIAKVYNVSRSATMEYFAQKKVFLNGRQTENTSLALKQDDVVTVRGYGRFKLAEIVGTSRKGKLNILVRL